MAAERIRRGLRFAVRGLGLAVLAPVVHSVLLGLTVLALVLLPVGIGVLALPAVVFAVRLVANRHRRWASAWSGITINTPYRPRPEPAPGARHWWRRFLWVVRDPATWRDFVWLLLEIPVGMALGLAPAVLLFYGVEGLLLVPAVHSGIASSFGSELLAPADTLLGVRLTAPQGALVLLLGVVAGAPAMWLHARFVRLFLAPTRSAELAQRVRHLAGSRSATVDAQAAELRRIERDLHDGAQARLVSLSMNIGLAEQLLDHDPDAAKQLLTEARQASGQALAELRDLVRGIHPPVLAERGLDGAVRALALAVPLPMDVDIDLPGRPSAPVESAAYFAAAEALTNLARHSQATRGWTQLTHTGTTLALRVSDDGIGGADPQAGTGLRGIERRLAAFDGTMTVTSPAGGPTVVTMELPCGLSSPKTSPSSATGSSGSSKPSPSRSSQPSTMGPPSSLP